MFRPSRRDCSSSRTSYLIYWLSHSFFFNICGAVLTTAAVVQLCTHILGCDRIGIWTAMPDIFGVLLILLLIPGSHTIGTVFFPMRIQSLYARRRVRSFSKIYVCIATRGMNIKALNRSMTRFETLQKVDKRLRAVVVTEPNMLAGQLQECQKNVQMWRIPANYVTGEAKYKARALEYFRITAKLGPEDWVLHLDEETLIDEHCLQACIDFIERCPEYMYGAGLILYNTVKYWHNPLLTVADLVRARDDLGRFQFSHGYLNFPLNGMHGAFFLANGEMENAISWETTNLTEDTWFAIKAYQTGFKGGFIPSVAREQPVGSVIDFFKQRRRWFCGLASLQSVNGIGIFNVIIWMASNLESLLIATLYLSKSHLRIPIWLYLWIQAYIGFGFYTFCMTLVIQDSDADIKPHRILVHLLMLPILVPCVFLLQIGAGIFSVVSPVTKFEVVKKH